MEHTVFQTRFSQRLTCSIAFCGLCVRAGPPWGCSEWHARHGQDLYLYGHFFSYVDRAHRQPVFIEAGANDGILESNTAALERCFGWSGILVEPDPRAIEDLTRNRPGSTVRQGCLASSQGDRVLSMVEHTELSTLNPVGGVSALSVFRDNGKISAPMQQVVVKCYALSALLAELHVEYVDYLSLDVEGSEQDVLQGIDWIHGPIISFISVEVAPTILGTQKQRDLRQYLQSVGYEFLDRIGFDDFYHRVGRGLGPDWAACAQAMPLLVESGARQLSWPQLAGDVAAWLDAFRASGGGGRADEATVLALRMVARWDEAEEICPLGAFVARLLVGLADYRLIMSGRQQSALALLVYRGSILYTDNQYSRAWKANPPVLSGAPTWRHVLPVPRLFLADLHFISAMLTNWPVFFALDTVSRYLWHSVPPIAGFEASRHFRLCGVSPDDFAAWEGILKNANVCGLLTYVKARIVSAHYKIQKRDVAGFRNVVLAAEGLLKRFMRIETEGFYAVLFYAGSEEPTIWGLFQNLSAQLHEHISGKEF